MKGFISIYAQYLLKCSTFRDGYFTIPNSVTTKTNKTMNLYFRLLWLIITQYRRSKKMPILGCSKTKFRVLPFDCDINLHLNNARYLSFMDLSRLHYLLEMGIFFRFLKMGWLPILNASELTFVRDLRPNQKFWVETRMLGWDEKYYYIEQQFVSERGVHCIATVRGVFVCKRKIVPVRDILDNVGFSGKTPELPQYIIQWKDMLNSKKQNHYQAQTGEAETEVNLQTSDETVC